MRRRLRFHASADAGAGGEITVDVMVPVGKTAEFVEPNGKVRRLNAGKRQIVQ